MAIVPVKIPTGKAVAGVEPAETIAAVVVVPRSAIAVAGVVVVVVDCSTLAH